ncbi:MAG: hypothetical protein ACD_7C00307G0005 [uncultured bacterium]|nr:MAG: hypothetical protein ACD_7C00307G0005 [uncultured bacterium]
MMNKKISTIAGSLIILAIAIALGFSFLASNKKEEIQGQNNVVSDNSELENKEVVKQREEKVTKNNQDEKITVDEMLVAKELYKNEKYGFEFVSPQDLFFRLNSTDDSIVLSDKRDGHWLFQITISKNSENLSLNSIINQEIKRTNNNYSFDISDTKIDDKIAKKILIKNYSDYGNTTVILVHKDNIVKIHGDNSTTSINESFESIINSFRFSK